MAWKITKNLVADSELNKDYEVSYSNNGNDHKVYVTYGKHLDIHALRGQEVYKKEVVNLTRAREFFDKCGSFENNLTCPVCCESSRDTSIFVKIWDVHYLKCNHCSHVYCDKVPSNHALEKYYSENVISNEYYTNPTEIELRIKNIYGPKLKWISETYYKTFGKYPKSILDLGAGSGHFVKSAANAGLTSFGYEIDSTYRSWAKRNLGIELIDNLDEIEKINSGAFDIVTSFNVIEHVNDLSGFMSNYKRFTTSDSLVIIETPKVNSMTSSLQQMYPDHIRGHLMPYIHTQLFSDASLLTLLEKNNFTPKHFWYFGQDVSELFYHLAREIDWKILDFLRIYFNPLQNVIDHSSSSDLMLVAATVA